MFPAPAAQPAGPAVQALTPPPRKPAASPNADTAPAQTSRPSADIIEFSHSALEFWAEARRQESVTTAMDMAADRPESEGPLADALADTPAVREAAASLDTDSLDLANAAEANLRIMLFALYLAQGMEAEEARDLAEEGVKQMGDLMEGAQGGPGLQAATGFRVTSETTVNLRIEGLEIRFQDGDRSISVSMQSISLEVTERTTVEGGVIFGAQDPLILDLDGNGFDTTNAHEGRLFDMDGDGEPEQVSWVRGNDALLALDRNGNGTIDDGTELFGDQNGAADGFAELARFDANGDGVIDADDPVYQALMLVDANGEARNMAEAGIANLRLDVVVPMNQRLTGGQLAATSGFHWQDGRQGTVGEVWFDVVA